MTKQAVVATAFLVALVAAASSSADSSAVTAYKAKLAAICRANAPRFRTNEKRMAAAEKANESTTFAVDLGVELGLILKQDAALYAVPMPTAAKSRMTPILSRLRRADSVIRSAVAAAIDGDQARFVSLFESMSNVAAPINRLFDGYGLRDCGSGEP